MEHRISYEPSRIPWSPPRASLKSLLFLIPIAFFVVFSGKSSSMYDAMALFSGPAYLMTAITSQPPSLNRETARTYRQPPEARVAPRAETDDLAPRPVASGGL